MGVVSTIATVIGAGTTAIRNIHKTKAKMQLKENLGKVGFRTGLSVNTDSMKSGISGMIAKRTGAV